MELVHTGESNERSTISFFLPIHDWLTQPEDGKEGKKKVCVEYNWYQNILVEKTL